MSPSIEIDRETTVSIHGDITTNLVREAAEGHYHMNITVIGDSAGVAQLRANSRKQITGLKADCYGTVNGSPDYREGPEAGVHITLGEVTSKS